MKINRISKVKLNRISTITPMIAKGVIKVELISKDENLNIMSNMRRIAQKAIKEKGLTEDDIKKQLLEIRYGKRKK